MIQVRLVNGAQGATIDFPNDTTVGDVRRQYGAAFNVANNATPVVNGIALDDSATLVDKDTLSFVRVTGEKGRQS